MIDYYINDVIQTNKSYMIVLMNGEVQEIILAGIKKSNLANIKSIDNTKKIQQISKFENNIKETKIFEKNSEFFKTNNTLKKDKTISTNNFNDKVKESKEKYFYDYNTQELSYQLMLTIEEDDGVFEGQVIEIKID